jgi:hypothetical protein
MGRYLVLAPAGRDDESLFEELGRLATREPSRFHVVVPRPREPAAADSARHHLDAVLEDLAGRGLDADGEVGQVSVVGLVAQAAERSSYDAVVIPVPAVRLVDTIDLEVARLHQIDVPVIQFVPPAGTTRS